MNLGPNIWDVVPNNLKETNSLEVFKQAIRIWQPENCSCQLCKVYVQSIGLFIKLNLKEAIVFDDKSQDNVINRYLRYFNRLCRLLLY